MNTMNSMIMGARIGFWVALILVILPHLGGCAGIPSLPVESRSCFNGDCRTRLYDFAGYTPASVRIVNTSGGAVKVYQNYDRNAAEGVELLPGSEVIIPVYDLPKVLTFVPFVTGGNSYASSCEFRDTRDLGTTVVIDDSGYARCRP